MDWLLVILLFLLLVLVSILIGPWILLGAVAYTGASEADGIIDKTNEFLREFPAGDIDSAVKFYSDLEVDTANNAARRMSDMQYAKTIMETILHHRLYELHPNKISRLTVAKNLKLLKTRPQGSFTGIDKLTGIIQKVDETPGNMHSAEEYYVVDMLREFGKNAENSKNNDLVESLREQLTRKNMEVRRLNEEAERLRNSQGKISSYSAEMFLEECNRDRKHLQDKISELRRDIEFRQKSGQVQPQQMDELRARNSQLENQLREYHNRTSAEATQVRDLTTQLSNCRQLLDDVLQAQ